MNRIFHLLALTFLAAALTLGGLACAGNDSRADEAVADDGAQNGEERRERGDDGENEDGDGENGENGEREEQAVPVQVTELERGAIESVLRFSTNLEAEEAVGVYSQAARQVRSLHVEEGDRVGKGQVLLRLDDEQQRTRLAKVRTELERARREFQRQERLYADDLISEQAFNDASYELNRLELDMEDAQRELSYTEVKAPISGTITQRRVSVGDTVTVNQHLFDMVDFDSIVARVYVPEKELARLETGLPARIAAPALSEEPQFKGYVDRLSPVVDPQSGTIKVTVAIPRQGGLRPGMYVDVELVTAVHEDAVLVPKRAVVYDDDQMFVYRMRDADDGGEAQGATVERVYLQPALEDERHIEPAAQQLAAGDRVVVAGQAGLKDGAKVRLAGERPAAADASADELPEDDGAAVAETDE